MKTMEDVRLVLDVKVQKEKEEHLWSENYTAKKYKLEILGDMNVLI